MIGLASLLSTKFELGDASDLLRRAGVGVSNDPNVASLLRKLAGAKLSLWRSMRFNTADDAYANCDPERLEHASDAVDYLTQAMVYPENADSPTPLIEGANAKLSAGNLVEALRDFSFVVSNYPAYPRLNAAIFRSACLLAYLGDRTQAATYFSYILDDPPQQSLGYGELEVRALLVCCALEAAGGGGGAVEEAARGSSSSSTGGKKKGVKFGEKGGGGMATVAKLLGVLGDAYEYRSDHLPSDLQRRPPEGVNFAIWAEPWRVLADRAVAKCDYVMAAEFLKVYLKRPTLLHFPASSDTTGGGSSSSGGCGDSGGSGGVDGNVANDDDDDDGGAEARMEAEAAERCRALCLLGECRMLLGDPERALASVEDAYGYDEAAPLPKAHLLAWAQEKWAPVLDSAAAKARAERLAAEEALRRRLRADKCGLHLEKHHKRQSTRRALAIWYVTWTRHFSATTMARVMRGSIARRRARFLAGKRQYLRANVKEVVWNINKHLLAHVMTEWHTVWVTDSGLRATAARPMLRRFQKRLLVAALWEWRERARKQVLGREAARKAMKGLKGMGATLKKKKLVPRSRAPPANGAVYSPQENEAWELLNPPQVYYSEPLNVLARYPEVREHHEQCVSKVLELKAQEDAYVAEANEALAAAAAAAAVGSPSSGKKKKKKKKKTSGRSSKVHPGGDAEGDGEEDGDGAEMKTPTKSRRAPKS